VSDEAWHKFLRFKRSQDTKIAAAHNRNCRRMKKINNYAEIIKKLEEKEEIEVTTYLKV